MKTRGSLKLIAALGALLSTSSCLEAAQYGLEWGADVAAAEGWMTMAMQGDAGAQYRVGQIYCCGKRPRYDNVRALYWFCKAGKQNQRDALYEIGELYQYAHEYPGTTIPRNNVMAATYYKLAAERGADDAVQPYRDLSLSMKDEEKAKVEELLEAWPEIPCEIYR